MTHTPGPWHVAGRGIVSGNECCLAVTETYSAMIGLAPAQREANAKLIAAAPLMLEALQRVIEQYSLEFGNKCDCDPSVGVESCLICLVRKAICTATGVDEHAGGKEIVLKYFSAKTVEQCEKNLYKYTDCGAWIKFHPWGIILGSIVEGSDKGTNTIELEYGSAFNSVAIHTALSQILKEAELIWTWANEVRENGKTDAENGLDWPLL